MLLKLLTAPLMLFPWKLLLASLVVFSSLGIYGYLTLADAFDWVPSLSAPSTETPNIHTAYLRYLLSNFLIWVVITIALPFLLVPINRITFNQQHNMTNALLLIFTISVSGTLAAYLFYSLLSLLLFLWFFSLLLAIATYYHYQSLSWLADRL